MIKQKQAKMNGLIFVLAIWLLSRLVILIAMLLIAPSLPAPLGAIVPAAGWEVFSSGDSNWYRKIAIDGYEYVYDTGEFPKQYSVAFFPVFPLFIRGIMALGLPFEVAGTLVSNSAFLGALLILYHWTEKHYGIRAACWITATLAWCPLSLFGTVIYSEGCFLLFSTAALQAFERQQYLWAALWGALSTATRPTGTALIPAFLITAWRERRPFVAYAVALVSGGGLFFFSVYCGVRFGDYLAFLHAQRAWRGSLGLNWMSWLLVLMPDWSPMEGSLLFALISGSGYVLWRRRKQLGSLTVGYGFCTLVLLLWLSGGESLILGMIPLGGIYLLWYLRSQLNLAVIVYGFCSLGLLVISGSAMSASRYSYGVVSVAIAFGLLLSRYPRWGYPTMGLFALMLGSLAVRFSQQLWIG